MFVSKNVVRMHDTDMAGIIFFAKQFRWAHDALEDWMQHENLGFHKLFTNNDFAFVIVHCEADYLEPLRVGDALKVHLSVGHVGQSSFTIHYAIYKEHGDLAGRCQTVHCTINPKTRSKVLLPDSLRTRLINYIKVDE